MKRIKIIVNAIPLVNIKTGIGRYIESLYSTIEREYGELFEIKYFDGSQIQCEMPQGPQQLSRWASLVDLFWVLPHQLSFPFRTAFHSYRERVFRKVAQFADVYHETAFFPFFPPTEMATIFTVHDLSLVRHPEWHPQERVRYFNKYFYRRLEIPQKILTVSEFTRSELLELTNVPMDKVEVTPLAYDSQIFRPQEANKIEVVKNKYGIRGNYFLCVGTNDPRKNIDLIGRVVSSADDDTQLIVAGWKGWGGKLSHGLLELGYVPDEDLPSLYCGATALIFPSLYEGFGLPVLEAMACGCPVVLTREASLPEVAGTAGCYLHGSHNVADLIAIMKRLESDSEYRAKKSEQSLKQAGHFSWKKTAQQTKDALLAAYEGKLK